MLLAVSEGHQSNEIPLSKEGYFIDQTDHVWFMKKVTFSIADLSTRFI